MKNKIVSLQIDESKECQPSATTIDFVFVEGLLYSSLNPEKAYLPKDVVKGCKPCSIKRCNEYLIETPDGDTGVATIAWSDFQTTDI